MRFHLSRFALATGFALTEHGRNRFATVLVLLFVPLWTTLAYLAMPDTPAPMQLHATGERLSPRGNELTEISGALNAITLITGFMMFSATFSGSRFDCRLAMSGYPRVHLVLAKVTGLGLISAVVAAYATAITCLAWSPRQPLLLAAALFSAGLTYGALGVIFGSAPRREVEGMFAIVMTSIIDLALQNPITSSGADTPIMRYLPSYESHAGQHRGGILQQPGAAPSGPTAALVRGNCPDRPDVLPPQHPQHPVCQHTASPRTALQSAATRPDMDRRDLWHGHHRVQPTPTPPRRRPRPSHLPRHPPFAPSHPT
ncbi:hypothetical protein SBADM41S_12104 [Streptomyces badius]